MKKSIIYLFSALIIFGISCTKEEEIKDNKTLTVEQAKATIEDMSGDMSIDLVELTQSEGIEGLKSLFDLVAVDDPFGGRQEITHKEYKDLLKDKARTFKRIFSPEKSITGRVEEGFPFEDNTGVYDWNFFEERFVKTGLADSIILNFPTENSTTLNATLLISDYDEVLVIDEFDEYYQPTALAGSFTVDNVLLIDLNLSIAYNNAGDPISGEIYLFLMPYTFELSFDDSATKSATLAASIAKGNETIVAIDVEVVFSDTQKEELLSVDGFVQYRGVKVSGSIENVESDDPNDYIDLSVYIDDQLLGEIVFEAEGTGDEMEYYAYVKYTDGSMERVEDVFEPVIMELEDFFDELDTWGDEGG